MANSLDTVTSSVGSSLDFAAKNFKGLAAGMTKVYLLEYAFTLVVAAILAAAVLGLGGAAILTKSFAVLVPLILIGIILLVFMGIVNASISLVRYSVVDDVGKRPTPIIKSAADNLQPAAVYELASLAGIIVLGGIPIAIGIALFAFGVAGVLLGALFFLLAIALIAAFLLLIQFAGVEIAVNRCGGIEALKRSAALVRKNLWAVLIFDIALFILSFAIGILFSIVDQVLVLGMGLGALSVAFFAFFFVIYLVALLAESVIAGCVITPATYFFWKAVGGKR